MKITSKAQFLALSNAGRLGNFLRSWNSLMEALEDPYEGPYTLRNHVPGSPHFVPVCMTAEDLLRAVKRLYDDGARLEDMYVTEIPDSAMLRNFNIEAMLTEYGVVMSFDKDTTDPVRGIRERGTFAEGLRAAAVLQALQPDSREMLDAIWDEYPSAVIEATEFAGPVGVFGRQLVIWECRDF